MELRIQGSRSLDLGAPSGSRSRKVLYKTIVISLDRSFMLNST
jgi:hypothetical protein